MKSSSFLRKLNRAVVVYQDLGLAAVGMRLGHRFMRAVGYDDPAHAEWMRKKASVDGAFDAAHGTQTGGIQEISGLKIVGENARYAKNHTASEPCYFTEMMGDLDLDLNNFTFIDLGSGKGRALMLASGYAFRRLIGVEFCYELHEAAIENLARFTSSNSAKFQVELVYGDAAAYAFPVEPLVIYLFNPFGSAVIGQVAHNAFVSWLDAPRPIHVLYMNPIHLQQFTEAGWRLSTGLTGGYAHLVPDCSRRK
jgi:hypothetical protein